MASVEVRQLGKSFGGEKALHDIDLSVDKGELFGLIGPDGAGKTTLFRILVTLLLPDEGEAYVDGLNVVTDYRRLRARLGYMPGRFSLYQDLSVEENLRFFATVFGTTVEENYDWIRPIYSRLEPFKDRRAGALSGGMKQKLALSCALIHRPSVLVLDEPTTGVDAVSRKEFWESLREIRESGVTILVSTPYMDEAKLCDRVALIQNGSLLQVEKPEKIEAAFPHPLLAVKAHDRFALLQLLRSHPFVLSAYAFGEYVHVADRREEADPNELAAFLRERGMADVEVLEVRPTIEDTFMELMQTR
ncbi:MAG: ABC transporter ATP-binding protein [Rhodothermales bacterium]